MVRRTPRDVRHRLLIAAAAAAALALTQGIVARPAFASYPHRQMRITRSGAIGSLMLNTSTASDIRRIWGPPGYAATGNFVGGTNPGYPNYRLLGYRCRHRVCAVSFYVSEETGRLESFATTSPRFALFGGVTVGMSANLASRREHSPNLLGCGQAIYLSTPQLSIDVWTRGGHAHMRAGSNQVSGGKVSGIGIEYNHYGVGVLFC